MLTAVREHLGRGALAQRWRLMREDFDVAAVLGDFEFLAFGHDLELGDEGGSGNAGG